MATFLLPIAISCKASIDAFGPTPAYARHAADNAFAAFAYRFYDVRRDSTFARAREQMGRYALIPSGIFKDSTIWNVFAPDSSRTLLVSATFANNHYTYTASPHAPHPRAVGDQRHSLNLKWLGGGDYEWFNTVDHAIGPVKPNAVAAAIVATFTAAEGRTADNALAEAGSLFPETARHLSKVFDLDSLTTTRDCCATTTTLNLTYRPERLRPRYTFFADFIEKYITPTVYRLQLTDRDGRQFFDATGAEGRLTFRVRSRNHQLVALTGPPNPMPDSLLLKVDVSMKWKMFRIGFKNLVGDFVIEKSEHRRAWAMRFHQEPSWQFPLAVDKLIKVPLRKPFQGRGAELTLGVRDDLGAQTISQRHSRFIVSESAIMRWLGGLGASAFSEFAGRTELEENLFLYETFEALRKDVNREW